MTPHPQGPHAGTGNNEGNDQSIFATVQESVQAVQIQGGAQIVMAVGFPLSRQVVQPEQTPVPSQPNNSRPHQLPHDL